MFTINHLAIWTIDLDKMKDFYVKYFNCKPSKKYINNKNSFESYFLDFNGETRVELMKKPTIVERDYHYVEQFIGIAHFSVSVGSHKSVCELTDKLKTDGYKIISEPRKTGDGFFESCILDPEGNMIELTI